MGCKSLTSNQHRCSPEQGPQIVVPYKSAIKTAIEARFYSNKRALVLLPECQRLAITIIHYFCVCEENLNLLMV